MAYNKYYKRVKIHRDDRDRNIEINETKTIDRVIYVLLLLSLFLIPLFIKAHIQGFVSPSLTFMNTGMQADIFSYYKYIFLIILTVLINILFLYKTLFLQNEIVKSKLNLLVGVLAVFVILSTIFSPFKSLALHGMFNRHEGALTYICYLAIFLVAANTKFSSKQLHGFLYSLYPFVIINMLLGLWLFNGKNLLEVDWIKNLILGSIPDGAQVSNGATLWATVSNPNYISGIGSVTTVLFLVWAIFDKNKLRSVINIIIATLSFVMILTSFSTSGFLTVLVLLPVILILVLFNKNKVKSLIVLVAFLVLATSVYVPMTKKNDRVWNESFGSVVNILGIQQKETPKNEISAPETEKPSSEAKKETTDLKKKNTNSEKQNPVSKKNSEKVRLNQESKSSSEPTDGEFKIPTLPQSGISAGTGRVYIWEKTLETAMEKPLFGYGMDTYSFVFPQNDIDKIAGLRTYNVIVDKPHNMYLGLLIGSGAFALLVFILLIVSVLIKGLKAVWKRNTTQSENAVMLTLFSGFIAYIVQGLMNDSVVGSAVIFWILLGVLVSILYKANIEAVEKED